MAIKMVREPSETPNINNIDDIVPMRYAYGNQNGYVIGKGNEISNTVNGLNFTVNSGRLVLQGVECDIDATGVTITIDNIATKRYYTVYLEVNLGLNTATIKSEYDTATYPSIDAGDDLTENTTGIARLPLYQFTATSGIISEVNKVVESVKYVNEDFIANVKVNDASKVNNLEIKHDENGVLKIGNTIIPQKILLWSGNVTSDNSSIQHGQIQGGIPSYVTAIQIKINSKYITVKKSDISGRDIPYSETFYGDYQSPPTFQLAVASVSLNPSSGYFTPSPGYLYEFNPQNGKFVEYFVGSCSVTEIYGIIE